MRGVWWLWAALLSDALIFAHLIGPARTLFLPTAWWGLGIAIAVGVSAPIWARRRAGRLAAYILLAALVLGAGFMFDGTALSPWTFLAFVIRPAGPRPGRWSAVGLFWGLGLVARFLFLPAPVIGAGDWVFWFYPLDAGLGCLGLMAWTTGWSPLSLVARAGRLRPAPTE